MSRSIIDIDTSSESTQTKISTSPQSLARARCCLAGREVLQTQYHYLIAPPSCLLSLILSIIYIYRTYLSLNACLSSAQSLLVDCHPMFSSTPNHTNSSLHTTPCFPLATHHNLCRQSTLINMLEFNANPKLHSHLQTLRNLSRLFWSSNFTRSLFASLFHTPRNHETT